MTSRRTEQLITTYTAALDDINRTTRTLHRALHNLDNAQPGIRSTPTDTTPNHTNIDRMTANIERNNQDLTVRQQRWITQEIGELARRAHRLSIWTTSWANPATKPGTPEPPNCWLLSDFLHRNPTAMHRYDEPRYDHTTPAGKKVRIGQWAHRWHTRYGRMPTDHELDQYTTHGKVRRPEPDHHIDNCRCN